ncbi:MAG TPA: peptidylprolyl isomerase [Caulobacteraceae bacterium]|jgi:peptidylprolyl isomerase|nr:peptidylprolyl isomerase [Caulobacteraceae bacterium]
MHLRRLAAAIFAATALAIPAAVSAPQSVTPGSVLASAPESDWRAIDPHDLLVMDLGEGRRVVIQLADGFAPVHAANIRRLAAARWYDGLAIERVQDNYVVQWGDPDGKKPLPDGLTRPAPAEYDRPATGLAFTALPYADTYAKAVGFSGGLPAAEDGGRAWLAHCYGMVGVGRDLNPDTGTGAELYAVIGTPPRALDRNIAVVGRVLSGVELLAALPRGTEEMGFYKPAARLPIISVRLASDLPAAEQPRVQVLDETSATFRAWIKVKANRSDDFFVRPAGALDLCNALPPVRGTGRAGM